MPRLSGPKLGLFLCLICLIWMAALSLAPTRAAVRYVDPAAQGAEHDGLTWSTAFQAIGPALVASSAGDEVRVAAGSYGEAVTLKEGVVLYGGFPGAADPDGQRDPVAHASNLLGGGSGPAVSAPVGLTDAAVLDGFSIQAEASTGVYCAAASPTIANTTFDQAGTGVNCGAGGAPRILNCVFRQCGTGVFALDTAPTVAGSLFIANGTGVRLGNSGGAVVNNTIAWCATGIALASSSATVANNILALNDTGLRADGAGASLRHNLVFSNGADYAGIGDPTGLNGNLHADPLFVNAASDDFHLRQGSPAINAGNDADVQTEFDLDGHARIGEGHVDIGAFESVKPPPVTAAEALRRAGGLTATAPMDIPAYDPETAPPSTGVVDILDALRIAREAYSRQ